MFTSAQTSIHLPKMELSEYARLSAMLPGNTAGALTMHLHCEGKVKCAFGHLLGLSMVILDPYWGKKQ